MKTIQTDCLIIGSGLAGASTALELSGSGVAVTMITRAERPSDTATSWAQGGIIFRSPKEAPGSLAKDIMSAGGGLCYEPAVNLLEREGAPLVQKVLMDRLQIPFDRAEGEVFDLTEEGAHSHPRIVHCGDQTGREIQTGILRELDQQSDVKILTKHTAIDLLTLSHHSTRSSDQYEPPRCIGAYVFDSNRNEVVAILSKETVLATGGMGQLYLHTTNPIGARGDGLAMAYRTGARIMNLEYIQFHPTALYRKNVDRFLISESLRGEGAKLLNHAGEEFMPRYDSRSTLAPRDVVARAIQDEMLREGVPFVYLNISHKPADWIQSRFPAIYKECLKEGFDLTKDSIPVVPAAHYSCGGVAVDFDGQTSLRNLKAVGEVSCTGVHGANRLASTSLLEDLVWGTRAGRKVRDEITAGQYEFPPIREWRTETEVVDKDLLTQDWMTIRQTMWNYVGLIRTPKRLTRAHHILRDLAEEIEDFYAHAAFSDDLIGLRHGIAAAQLVVSAARRNRESLGCHFIRSQAG